MPKLTLKFYLHKYFYKSKYEDTLQPLITCFLYTLTTCFVHSYFWNNFQFTMQTLYRMGIWSHGDYINGTFNNVVNTHHLWNWMRSQMKVAAKRWNQKDLFLPLMLFPCKHIKRRSFILSYKCHKRMLQGRKMEKDQNVSCFNLFSSKNLLLV